jgi:hypothetical protein
MAVLRRHIQDRLRNSEDKARGAGKYGEAGIRVGVREVTTTNGWGALGLVEQVDFGVDGEGMVLVSREDRRSESGSWQVRSGVSLRLMEAG